MEHVQGVHLIGSIRLPSTTHDNRPKVEEIFTETPALLPGLLKRISDGELGFRDSFVGWQNLCFFATPWLLHDGELAMLGVTQAPFSYTWPPPGAGGKGDITDGKETIVDSDGKSEPQPIIKAPANPTADDILLGPTGYDMYALRSYKVFSSLKRAGKIEEHIRFMVCLPTPINSMWCVKKQYKTLVEPLYLENLKYALDVICSSIPASELAVQIDMAVEFGIWDGAAAFLGDRMEPWFDLSAQVMAEKAVAIVEDLPAGVEVGYHLCYGNFMDKHTVEPTDLKHAVAMANELKKVSKRMDWVHMPVPLGRKDEEFVSALKDLQVGNSEVYLGVVHAGDLEGTKERCQVAGKALGRTFGVATECGWGRKTGEWISGAAEVMREVARPW